MTLYGHPTNGPGTCATCGKNQTIEEAISSDNCSDCDEKIDGIRATLCDPPKPENSQERPS